MGLIFPPFDEREAGSGGLEHSVSAQQPQPANLAQEAFARKERHQHSPLPAADRPQPVCADGAAATWYKKMMR